MLRSALLSGGLAGLAGASEVAGLKGYLTADLSPGFGYAGIVVAMLAMLKPLGVVAAAIFVAGIFVGADAMSRTLGVLELHRRPHRRPRAALRARRRIALRCAISAFGARRCRMERRSTSSPSASFWAAAIRIATPLIFGALGALICERAGVLNLGIEGILTAGALAGWLAVYLGARPVDRRRSSRRWPAPRFGLLHALLTVPLGLSQHVTGIGVTLLATSASYFIYRLALPNVTTPPRIAPFQPLHVPGLSDLPVHRPGAVPADAADLSRLRARSRSSPACSTARRSASPCARPAKTRPRSRRRASTSSRSASARSSPARR